MAGIIMTDDIKAMTDEVKKLGEAVTAMRGALLAAAKGSAALAVRTILLDSVQIADAAIRGIHDMAEVQPRQQSLPNGDQLDVTVGEETVTFRHRRRPEANGDVAR